ncbi:MAG: homogentisate 1,2-dioxygenase [Acidimicrobiales bacterium]
MPYFRQAGDVPRKRHVRVPHPGGSGHLAEELVGEDGFTAESSLLYHLGSPSAVTAISRVDDPAAVDFAPDRPLVPRHLRTGELPAGGDVVTGRHRLLHNDDLTVGWTAATETSELYRSAVGDELLYVHDGAGVLDSAFGSLAVAGGDYVVVPRGTTHRWRVTEGPLRALVLEVAGHVRFPDRYLSPGGQLLEGSPFCERDLRGPVLEAPMGQTGVAVLVRNQAGLSRHEHVHHPFDVVGWAGCLYPFALSIHDFEPIVGAIHQPPPVHQTFAGPGVVVCSFVPRPYDFHPDAAKVPYHHANVDSDEVLFYAGGDFMSRTGSGVGAGSITMHPAGFVHGPQPGSLERAIGETRTEELAVMVDTFRPLHLSEAARRIADDAYVSSWARGLGT